MPHGEMFLKKSPNVGGFAFVVEEPLARDESKRDNNEDEAVVVDRGCWKAPNNKHNAVDS